MKAAVVVAGGEAGDRALRCAGRFSEATGTPVLAVELVDALRAETSRGPWQYLGPLHACRDRAARLSARALALGVRVEPVPVVRFHGERPHDAVLRAALERDADLVFSSSGRARLAWRPERPLLDPLRASEVMPVAVVGPQCGPPPVKTGPYGVVVVVPESHEEASELMRFARPFVHATSASVVLLALHIPRLADGGAERQREVLGASLRRHAASLCREGARIECVVSRPIAPIETEGVISDVCRTAAAELAILPAARPISWAVRPAIGRLRAARLPVPALMAPALRHHSRWARGW